MKQYRQVDRSAMTRHTIGPAQQTAARVAGFNYLFTLATVVLLSSVPPTV